MAFAIYLVVAILSLSQPSQAFRQQPLKKSSRMKKLEVNTASSKKTAVSMAHAPRNAQSAGAAVKMSRQSGKSPADAFPAGIYDITADVRVTSDMHRSETTQQVSELKIGDAVNILQVEYDEADTRVRAFVESPEGWISLLDTSDDFVWASSRAAFCRAAWTCSYNYDKCQTSPEGVCVPLPLPGSSKVDADGFFDAQETHEPSNSVVATGPAADFAVGVYDITAEVMEVSSGIALDSGSVASLKTGDVITVTKVEYHQADNRVRALIETPKGWVSLLDTEDGFRWAQDRTAFCKGVMSCSWNTDKCISQDGKCLPLAAAKATATTATVDFDISEFALGAYDMLEGGIVSEGKEIATADLGKLDMGATVNVVEVEYVASISRVRARIEQPSGGLSGWISLLDTEEGFRWVQNRAAFCAQVQWCKYNYDKCHWAEGSEGGAGSCAPNSYPATTTTTLNKKYHIVKATTTTTTTGPTTTTTTTTTAEEAPEAGGKEEAPDAAGKESAARRSAGTCLGAMLMVLLYQSV